MLDEEMVPFTLSPSGIFHKPRLVEIYSSQLRHDDVAIAMNAPFKGEVLLGIRGMQTYGHLLLEEISWTDLSL